MANITIRNLDDEVKTRLRMRAAENGRSMEEEARRILREAVRRKPDVQNLARSIRARFAPLGGVELELPPRGPGREHEQPARTAGSLQKLGTRPA